MLRLEQVSVHAHGGSVLDDLSLVVPAKSVAVVFGPRGSGKSTLLAVAAGALSPRAGAVWLGSRDIAGLQRSSLPYVRRNIGYLPQDPPLLDEETALENVMLALGVRGEAPASAAVDAADALVRLGAAGLEARRVVTLSAGERRLVALARALAGPPAVIVLDDPARELDPVDRRTLLVALASARDEGAAILCGTADPAFAAQAVDELRAQRLELDDGRLVGAAPIALVRPADPEGTGAADADPTASGRRAP